MRFTPRGIDYYYEKATLSVPRERCYIPVNHISRSKGGADSMPKGEQRGNREAKKPKKEKPKTTAAAPSMKGAGSSGGFKK